MKNNLKTAVVTAVLAAGLLAATQLQAHGTSTADGLTSSPGQMMGDRTRPGTMDMMGRMDEMLKTCNSMMQDQQMKPAEPGEGHEQED